MSLKKTIGTILKRILPFKYYKIIANGGIIVPSYYKTIIEDAERYLDYSLEESPEKDILLMRKYAHIIDKGLHRQDIEPGHSKSYYKLLKEKVEKLKQTPFASDPTIQWAQNKIEYYERLQTTPQSFLPLQGKTELPPINYEQLSELIKQRRSNRFFQEVNLSDETVNRLSILVNWAANSCNKQPIQLFITNIPSKASECLKCCKGGTGFSAFIPSFWVFAADSRGYVWPSEIHLPAIDTSLGAQNVFLAAQTLGITGTILSWAQKDKEEEATLRTLLNIPKEFIIVFCAVMGYASHNYLPPQRKDTK
ncbi:nitroreductase family protein [Bacteroides sp.]